MYGFGWELQKWRLALHRRTLLSLSRLQEYVQKVSRENSMEILTFVISFINSLMQNALITINFFNLIKS